MTEASLDWISLPTTRYAGAADQPRSPAPTMVSWPPPPARDSAPPPLDEGAGSADVGVVDETDGG